MTEHDDDHAAALMRAAQQGNQQAYADLLGLLTTAARRYVRSRSGDVSWMDDAVQEILIAVHRARHTWNPARPFAPWFYAIAAHRSVDVFRRAHRVGQRETVPEDLERHATPVDDGSDADTVDMEAVRAALAALPARQRDIIEGLKLRDESVKHLATRHGMSESAVKVMAHRGYKRLRALLGNAPEDEA